MNNFEDWKEEYGLQSEPNYSEHTEKDCKNAFEAGAQSKQAEINDLQAKLNCCREENKRLLGLVNELKGNQSNFFANAEQPPKHDIKW